MIPVPAIIVTVSPSVIVSVPPVPDAAKLQLDIVPPLEGISVKLTSPFASDISILVVPDVEGAVASVSNEGTLILSDFKVNTAVATAGNSNDKIAAPYDAPPAVMFQYMLLFAIDNDGKSVLKIDNPV